jgi:hypothetical protein
MGCCKFFFDPPAPIFELSQNLAHSRNYNIQTLPNLVSNLTWGQYKNIDFLVSNDGIDQV